MNFNYHLLAREKARLFKKFTFPAYWRKLEEVGGDLWADGVSSNEKLIGLLIAEADQQNSCGKILSVFTVPEYRNQGVGEELISRAESQCKKRNLESIEIVYTENNSTFALEKILENRGWSPLKQRLQICRGFVENIKNAPWLNYKISSSEYTIFPWKELSWRKKREIQKSQRENSWYPNELCPFTEENTIYHPSSFGLRYKDQVIGWMIANRLNADVIRYSSLFIKQEMQGKGLAIAMLASAITNQIHMAEASEALFSVKADNEHMLKLSKKHLRPFLKSIHRSVYSEKRLDYLSQY
jgi:GNAT superfamily N-acetyltransferase